MLIIIPENVPGANFSPIKAVATLLKAGWVNVVLCSPFRFGLSHTKKLYFFAMKSYLALFVLPFFISCQNDSPATKPSNKALLRDSAIVKTEVPNPYLPVDRSPLDIVYFPTNYPVQKMNGELTSPPVARVIYSRPHRQGRQIFGNIVKWGEPWRLGANEATEIELFRPVAIQNKRVAAGRYILYAVPHEDDWTIVFNSNLFTWGLKFNLAKNETMFDIPVANKEQTVEYFTMVFEKTGTGAELVMAWENKEARLPMEF